MAPEPGTARPWAPAGTDPDVLSPAVCQDGVQVPHVGVCTVTEEGCRVLGPFLTKFWEFFDCLPSKLQLGKSAIFR